MEYTGGCRERGILFICEKHKNDKPKNKGGKPVCGEIEAIMIMSDKNANMFKVDLLGLCLDLVTRSTDTRPRSNVRSVL